jgi:hypothetical protein
MSEIEFIRLYLGALVDIFFRIDLKSGANNVEMSFKY